MPGLIQRFKERQVVQWGLAYVAGGWLFLEILEFVAGNFGWPAALVRSATVVVGAGFFATLVLAWYHGELGRQRVSRPELLIIAGVAALCAIVLTSLQPPPPQTRLADQTAVTDPASEQSELVSEGAIDATPIRTGRVLVLPFTNATGDAELDRLGGLGSSWIERQLTQAGIASVVPYRYVAGGERETDVAGDVSLLAERTRAELVVTGEFYLRGAVVEVAVQIVDPVEDRVVHDLEPARDDASDPLDAFDAVGLQVVGALATHYERDWPRPELYSPPPSLEVLELYSQAFEHLARLEHEQAVETFLQAWERDTTWVGTLAGLAGALASLGRWREADSVTAYLETRRDRLTPVERAWIDMLRGRLDGDLELQYRSVRRAAALDPVWFSLGAATAASRTNRLDEALEHLGRRDLERTWGQHPGWDYLHIEVLMRLGRFEEALEVTRAAKRTHPDLADLLTREALGLAALGRTDDLLALYDEARGHPASASAGWSPGSPLAWAAQVFHALNRTGDARRFAELALETFERSEGDTRDGRAQALYFAGRPGEAEALFAALSGGDPEDMEWLGWRGAILAEMGRVDDAQAVHDRLSALQLEYFLPGQRLFYQSWISASLGDSNRALDELARALETGQSFSGHWTMWATFYDELREDPRYRRLIAPRN